MATLAQRGAGTPATSGTAWTTTTNAVDGTPGTNPATYAVWTSVTSGATAYIEVTGYNFAAIDNAWTLNSVTVSLRHFENNITRIASVTFQAYAGATPLGSAVTATRSLSARDDAATFPVTLAQLKAGTFKVRATATRAAVTQSATFNVDHIDVTADYTAPVPMAGSATATWSATVTASGTAPVVVPPAEAGTRAVETGGQRALEDATSRALESFVGAPPNEGAATAAWAATVTAAGKKTPKGASTSGHLWTVTAAGTKPLRGSATATWSAIVTTAAGKETPKGSATANFVETAAGVGRKVPKATVTSSHTWTAIAQGVKPVVGAKQGSALVFTAWAPTAAGKRTPKGNRSIPVLWTPTATGRKSQQATVTATFLYSPTAAGRKIQKGAATVEVFRIPVAAGKRVPKGSRSIPVLWVVTATGVRGIVEGYVTGWYNESAVIAMYWHPDEVVDFQLTPV